MAGFAQEPSESYLNLKRRFSDFLHDYRPARNEPYAERIEGLFGDEKKPGVNARLLIDILDIQQFDEKLHEGVLKEPVETIRPCIDAVRDAARGLQDGQFGQKHASEIEVRFRAFWMPAEEFSPVFRLNWSQAKRTLSTCLYRCNGRKAV